MTTITEPSTQDEWLDYLENRHVTPIQLGLERVKAIAGVLDVTAWDIPVITVAGTNGKGSTVAALESIYQAAGLRVAAYTSPHLLQFNERIRMNCEPISADALCQMLSKLHALPESQSLTYFEMTTLAALLYFKQMLPQVLILEVGLGGRLDATNIIDADLAIITTVDLDHQAWLGETREAIGHEKAGILRAKIPVIFADEAPPASVLAQASQLGAQWLGLNTEYSYQHIAQDLIVQLDNLRVRLPCPQINLKAAVAALVATNCLRARLPVTHADWALAFARVRIPARSQVIPGLVNTLLDVAHNPQAARLLADNLQKKYPSSRIHVVFAALADKDIAGLVAPLQALATHWCIAALNGPRALQACVLGTILMQCGVSSEIITVCDDPLSAYHRALRMAEAGDWVVVYGSFLTVAPILALLQKQESV